MMKFINIIVNEKLDSLNNFKDKLHYAKEDRVSDEDENIVAKIKALSSRVQKNCPDDNIIENLDEVVTTC